jgi:chromate transporter
MLVTAGRSTDTNPAERVGWRDALGVWAYIGLNSFGGPAGQIAVMHRVIVDTRRWVSDQRFLHALNYCMLLPGPEAQQLSVYIGWLMHGVRGGLLAGTLFIVPGFLVMLALSALYVTYQGTAFIEALFYGLAPAVVAIIAAALVRVGRRALTDRFLVVTATAAFVAMYFLAVPFPLVIVAAGLAGYARSRRRAARLLESPPRAEHPMAQDPGAPALPTARRLLSTLAIGLGLWLIPVAALLAFFGGDVYTSLAVFFSGAAVVTFGGAYAVLTYVAEQAVQVYGWLTPTQMLDGLALAETTPGPLIMVVEFVGFLAAAGRSGGLDPIVAGTIGAVLVTWVTFVPSFLWVFLGAPYSEYLRHDTRIAGTLSAISAAVVGAIVNLAVWFTLHAIFGVVDVVQVGPARLYVPEVDTLQVGALVIAVGAAIAVFRLRLPTLLVLAASAVVGAIVYLAFVA